MEAVAQQVMVVEDEYKLRELLRAYLERERQRWSTFVAEHGIKAE